MSIANVLVVAPIASWNRLEPGFEGAFCQPRHTDRPHEALRLLAEHQVDVVIVDSRFPGHITIELLNLVAHLHPTVFRVLLTPFDDLHLALRALNEGQAQRFIIDGGTQQHLHQVLFELMSHR